MRPDTATLADIQSDFDWAEYLRLLGPEAGEPAPASCFKQSAEPPPNRFRPGQRLESRDPRNPDNTCIASVIDLLGPRLRLRLDGSDDRNDFYRLVDSEDLFPHPSGRFIVPPLGFAKSSNYWPGFLEKVKAAGNFAPADCFVKPPASPAKNIFSVGQKLEAIDRKNPLFVCPATVKEVRQDRIFVSFDGWRGAFDYWCRYDCRDIFPVGWCRRAGYPVQQPGNRAPHQQQQQRSRGKQVSGCSSPSPNSGTFSDKSAAPSPQLPVSTSASTSTPAAAPVAASAPVAVHVRPAAGNPSHFSADSLRRRFDQLLDGEKLYSGLPNDALRDLLQACLDCSRSASRLLTRMPRCGAPGSGDSAGHVLLGAQETGGFGSGNNSAKRRLRRVLPRVDSAEEFWRIVDEFLAQIGSRGLFSPAVERDDNETENSAANDESNAASDVKSASPSPTTEPDPEPDAALDETPPPAASSTQAESSASVASDQLLLKVENDHLADVEAKPSPLTSAALLPGRGSLDSNMPAADSSRTSAGAADTAQVKPTGTVSQLSGRSSIAEDDAGSGGGGGSTAPKLARLSDPGVSASPSSDMSDWSVSDVSQFLRDSGLGSLVPLFADQAIDGAALMLLNTQAMMKFMGVKLGPALKLLSCVEKAKRRLSLLNSMRSAYRHC